MVFRYYAGIVIRLKDFMENVHINNNHDQAHILEYVICDMRLKKGQTNSGSYKKGHKPSTEIIKKRADALRGRHHSEESKRKMSLAKKGIPKPKQSKFMKELWKFI